jgi:hypothetical protein
MDPASEPYRRWRNLNGCSAYLASEGITGTEYRALFNIYTALEDNPKKKKDLKSIIECQVPIAATYFQLCAPVLYSACVSQWGLDESNWAGNLWTGEKGYSLPRWSFWKKRLAEIEESDLANDEIKSAITKALIEMDKAEKQNLA